MTMTSSYTMSRSSRGRARKEKDWPVIGLLQGRALSSDVSVYQIFESGVLSLPGQVWCRGLFGVLS